MPKYYKFMLGKESKYAAECYESEFIGTWYGIDEDLTDCLNNKEKFNEKYIPVLMDNHSRFNENEEEREERYKEQSARKSILQLWIFCKEMQTDDIIICPTEKNSKSYHIGKIKSDYYYKKDYFKDGNIQPHRRDVEWFINKIKKNVFSKELIKKINLPGTVIDLNSYTNEIQKLISVDSDNEKVIPKKSESGIKKYTEYLRKYLDQIVIDILVQYLNKILPNVSNDWWEITVKDKLKPYQLKRIKRNNINSLDEFDLAELLLIIDNNWYDISQECNFMYNDRNIVKEMISVRNRVSHLSNVGYSSLIDLFRDFDTMRRLIIIISIEQKNIQKIINDINEIMLEIMREILVDKGINP